MQFFFHFGFECIPSCVTVVYVWTPIIFPQLFPESGSWGAFARHHPHCWPEGIIAVPHFGGLAMRTHGESPSLENRASITFPYAHEEFCLRRSQSIISLVSFFRSFPPRVLFIQSPTVMFLTDRFSNYISEWEQSVLLLKLKYGHSSPNSHSKQNYDWNFSVVNFAQIFVIAIRIYTHKHIIS